MTEETFAKLIDLAIDVRTYAHAPYSKFQVGAALLVEGGRTFTGCNVENASFSLCICAERVAVASAVTAGELGLVAMVIAAHPIAAPCGSCRQFIAELSPPEFQVLAIDALDRSLQKRWSIEELLPDRFRLEH